MRFEIKSDELHYDDAKIEKVVDMVNAETSIRVNFGTSTAETRILAKLLDMARVKKVDVFIDSVRTDNDRDVNIYLLLTHRAPKVKQ